MYEELRSQNTHVHCIVEACLEGGGGGGGGLTIFLEVNRQVSLMNWQISPSFFSEYPISLTVTKLLDTVRSYTIMA